ncbi:Allergen Tha p 2 [Pseudolycoriella hygida]|uniref:Allergen Tha p 2 n=1 Tax=Pseudolycoriella hygida TaxID=35572 RepID=A0A9Q0N678_9DIPT|nr:Allergen Tha p 2 [Pseudolycoriella hygida]
MLYLNCRLLSVLVLLKYANAWSSFESLGGGVTAIASASWGPGRIDLFAPAGDGQIWHKAFASGSWGGWGGIGGLNLNTKLKPSAFSIKPNWVDIVYTGTDESLYRKTWNGNAWSDWKKSTNGGSFLSGPSITASPGDTTYLHVFVIGKDTALWHCAIDVNTNTWTTWESMGGGLIGDPAAVSWGPGRFDIFCIAGDSQLWQKTYDNGWKDWQLVYGGLFRPGVGAASKATGSLSVFLKGGDDAVWHRSYSNGAWQDLERIGGKIQSSPSAVSTGSTRIDVYSVGASDSAVYQSYWETRTEPDKDHNNYGCFKGKCWSKCSTTFVSIISEYEWCYSTKGNSQDFQYVACETYNTCNPKWKCAGSCTV